MLLFPVHWRITICAVVAVLLMIAAGYWQKYQRAGAPVRFAKITDPAGGRSGTPGPGRPGKVADVDKGLPEDEIPETKPVDSALEVRPRATLREPAPDAAAGQMLQGNFRVHLGPRGQVIHAVRLPARWLSDRGLWEGALHFRLGPSNRRAKSHASAARKRGGVEDTTGPVSRWANDGNKWCRPQRNLAVESANSLGS